MVTKTEANEAFVREYQRINGLREDGWAGSDTFGKLRGPQSSGPFNSTPFFNNIRSQLFGGTLTGPQVEGINADLDGCSGLPLSFVAYILATDYHETGKTMQPVSESLNYSVEALKQKYAPRRISVADAERYGRLGTRPADQPSIASRIYGGAWGIDNLGNTQEGDGWAFRGRGKAQITGRRNYRRFAIEARPELAAQMATAVVVLVDGSVNGEFTGKKLGDYLPSSGPASRDQFIAARRVINGTDQADKIAGYALAFQSALQAGGWR